MNGADHVLHNRAEVCNSVLNDFELYDAVIEHNGSKWCSKKRPQAATHLSPLASRRKLTTIREYISAIFYYEDTAFSTAPFQTIVASNNYNKTTGLQPCHLNTSLRNAVVYKPH